MKLLVESYGCTLNRGEGDEFSDAAIAAGHSIVDSEEEAEVAVLFTCGVIETTERRMLKRIRELSGFDTLLVCGCLGNICAEEVANTAPNAILIRPTEHLDALGLLKNADEIHHPEDYGRSGIGILPIASGCSGECAYCVTKLARGALKSRPIGDVVQRAGRLISGGAVELQICAQDTAVYGKDIGTNLGVIVDELTRLKGEFMMRIGMMNPNNALDSLDDVLAAFGSDKVFKFLHLPVQSGSDAVLERMGRGYNVDVFLTVLDKFRDRFPDSTISTDIITGFPGETEDEFGETVALLDKTRPDVVNVTRFSARPGTAAASMGKQVVSRISKDRSRILTDLRFEILSSKLESRVGLTVNALTTEHRQPGTTFLRTRDYWPIAIDGEGPLGEWHDVRITEAERTHLTGTLS